MDGQENKKNFEKLRLLKIKEVAALLNVSVRVCQRLSRFDAFPKSIKIGKRKRWFYQDIKKYLDSLKSE